MKILPTLRQFPWSSRDIGWVTKAMCPKQRPATVSSAPGWPKGSVQKLSSKSGLMIGKLS